MACSFFCHLLSGEPVHRFSLRTFTVKVYVSRGKWKKEILQKYCWQISEDAAHGNVLWASHTARSQLAVWEWDRLIEIRLKAPLSLLWHAEGRLCLITSWGEKNRLRSLSPCTAISLTGRRVCRDLWDCSTCYARDIQKKHTAKINKNAEWWYHKAECSVLHPNYRYSAAFACLIDRTVIHRYPHEGFGNDSTSVKSCHRELQCCNGRSCVVEVAR